MYKKHELRPLQSLEEACCLRVRIWSLNEDRTLIEFDFPSEPPVRLEYDASNLTIYCLLLGGKLRGAMEPPGSDDDPTLEREYQVLVYRSVLCFRELDKESLFLASVYSWPRWLDAIVARRHEI